MDYVVACLLACVLVGMLCGYVFVCLVCWYDFRWDSDDFPYDGWYR